MKVVNFKHEGASASLMIWGSGTEGKATLISLYSIRRGRGHAKVLLDKIMSYADTHDLTLTLDAKRFGPNIVSALSNKQLVSLYERFGFRAVDTSRLGTIMVRLPKPQEINMELHEIVTALRSQVVERGLLDVGAGAEHLLGTSRVKFNSAVAVLKNEGFVTHVVQIQRPDTVVKTVVKVLAPRGTKYKDVMTAGFEGIGHIIRPVSE